MSRNPSPVIAATLSLIFPGLGQIYAGQTRRGVLWALPTLALILLAAIVLVGHVSLTSLITAEATLGIIALEFAFLFYHLAAMLDAYNIASRERKAAGFTVAGSAVAGLVVLIIVAVLFHGYPLYVSVIGNNAFNTIFVGRPDVLPSPSFSAEPIESIPVDVTDSPATTTPGATASATPTNGSTSTPGEATPTPTSLPPLNTPWGDRLNLLLIGSDAGPGRHGGRTDTMILLSVDIPTGRAVMFGFPRNMTNVPIEDASGNLQFDRIWTDPDPPGNGNPSLSLLTNLWQHAYNSPGQFFTPTDSCDPNDPNLNQCRGDARAFRATAMAIQNLAGVPINGGIIAVNLEAFRDLVDAVGGVWMDVPSPVYDDQYPAGDGVSPHIINIPAGCNWFNGVYALAYARSRHQDSDYQRMKRQQLVLQAIRRQFDPIAMLPKADQLLQVASDNLWTTISRDDIPLLAQVASRVDPNQITTVRFTPQAYPSQLTDSEIKAIRSRVQNFFTQQQPTPTPTPGNPKDRCPAPGQTPGPTFDTHPSP